VPDAPISSYEDPIAVIHSTRGAMKKFCEDALSQLEALDSAD
jgi:hypothetical protein